MTEETGLLSLTTDYLDSLKRLDQMMDQSSTFGGMSRRQMSEISKRCIAEAREELERRRNVFQFSDDISADSEAFTAIQQAIEAERDNKIVASINMPFQERLDGIMPPVSGLGPTAAYLIGHSIRNARANTQTDNIATYGLKADTPSLRSEDITQLPSWIDTTIDFCDAHQRVIFKPEETDKISEFRELLLRMKTIALELLEIKNQIRETLGLGPIKIEVRPDKTRDDLVASVKPNMQ